MRGRLLPTLAAIATLALTVSLGQWQLRRADEKAALQAGRDAALAAAPLPLADAPADARALDGRRVVATGRFDEARTIFLDNRTRQGVAGFHVLTPLRLEARETHVMVLRGWVARDRLDRTKLPDLPALPATVHIEGLAMAELPQPIVLASDGAEPGAGIRQRWDADAYARWSGLALLPIVVRQTSALPDGLARDWVQPGTGVDKHRAYAFQWFAIATATFALWLWFAVFGRTRHRQAP